MESQQPQATVRPNAPADTHHSHWVLSAGKLSIGTLASRLLGVVRDSMRAYLFGTGMAADAFTVAFRLPNMLRALFAEGALSAAYVPVLTQTIEQGRPDEWRRLVLNVATLLALALFAVTLLGILVAPLLVPLMVPGYERIPGKLPLTISLTRWLFPYIFFVGLATFAMGTLTARRRFTTPAMSAAILNLAMIAAMAFVVPRLGPATARMIRGLAWGVLVGGVLQLAIQVPPLFRERVFVRFRVRLRDARVQRIALLMIPGAIGLGVAEINGLVDTLLASLLPAGSVAALEYGQRVMQLPLGVFAVALGTAVLPTLSAYAARRETEKLEQTFRLGLRLTLFILLPLTGFFIAVHRPMLRLLFQRGAFDEHSLNMTAYAFIFYTLGLCAYGAVKVIVPVFYSRQNTQTPVRIGIIAMCANVILNITLMRFMQLGGLALATALSSMLNVTLLLRSMRRQYGLGPGREVHRTAVRSLLATLACVGAALLVLLGFRWHPLFGGLLRTLTTVVAAAVASGAAYLVTAHALRSEELIFLRRLVSSRPAATE